MFEAGFSIKVLSRIRSAGFPPPKVAINSVDLKLFEGRFAVGPHVPSSGMHALVHSAQARSIVTVWRDSDTDITEVFAFKLAPVATPNTVGDIADPMKGV